jgi:predicted DNA-binding protein with PD1-like motif
MATSAVLPHRAGHLLKRVVFRTGEVMVFEDPGQPAGDIKTRGCQPTGRPISVGL